MPVKTFKGGGGSKKGKQNLSYECLKRMRNKNSLRRKAKSTNSEVDWEIWRKEKNDVNNLLRKETIENQTVELLAAEKDITSRKL